ncbi:MAG: hypothetical protein HQL53_13295 [Magnetococcales bacterium]|nr:hypothetical protein [Magnetococcales bacterium]
MMYLLKSPPLFGLLLIIYNVIAFSKAGLEGAWLDQIWLQTNLPSGQPLTLTVGIMMVVIGAFLLHSEWSKTLRNRQPYPPKFSFIISSIYLIELLWFPPAGNAVFMILTLFTLLDALARLTLPRSQGHNRHST